MVYLLLSLGLSCNSPKEQGISQNLLVNKPATSSPSCGQGKLAYLTDGKINQIKRDAHGIFGTTTTRYPFIEFDLKSLHRIDSILLFQDVGCCTDPLIQLVSHVTSDSSDFVGAFLNEGCFNSQGNPLPFPIGFRGNARYGNKVKIWAYENTCMTFSEIQVFGAPVSSIPDTAKQLTKRKVEKFKELKFLATGDPQYSYKDKVAEGASNFVMNEVRKKLNENLGLVIAGDMTHEARPEELVTYQHSIKGFEKKVYEGLGNHDYALIEAPQNKAQFDRYGIHELDMYPDRTWSKTTFEIMDFVRDKAREAKTNFMKNNINYSWDWEDIHFIQLNLTPGNHPTPQKKIQNPLASRNFLSWDLANNLNDPNQPIVLIHHYGLGKLSKGIINGEILNNKEWWTVAQRKAYYDIIHKYNVVAILTGHQHDCNVCYVPWEGEEVNPDLDPIPSFIVGGALHGYYSTCHITDDNFSITRYYKDQAISTETIKIKR